MRIQPNFGKPNYQIFDCLLSARGYIIYQGRSTNYKQEADILTVYSINGDQISVKLCSELINSLTLDPTHYFIVFFAQINLIKDNWRKYEENKTIKYNNSE